MKKQFLATFIVGGFSLVTLAQGLPNALPRTAIQSIAVTTENANSPDVKKLNSQQIVKTKELTERTTLGTANGGGGVSAADSSGQRRLLDLIEKDELEYFNPETVLKKSEGYYSSVSPAYVFMHFYAKFAVKIQDLNCKENLEIEPSIWGDNAFLLTVALSYLPGINTSEMRCDSQSFSKMMNSTYKRLKIEPVEQLRWAFTEHDLQNLNDEGLIRIENPQTKRQLAVQTGILVLINKKEFTSLDEESKQALFIHESVLRAVLLLNPEHIKEHGTQYVRAYVRSALRLFNSLGTPGQVPHYTVTEAYKRFEINK